MIRVKCPECHSTDIAKILYGMPVMNEKMQKDISNGKIVLGGCCLDESNPVYHCNKCGHEF